ncbi:hypothetical protein [Phenylobacterium kunshanense]|uniref:Uncharacterized protein n=1 Tax=Phenylobacterium kunshanense TaxID=1445034 RepID=A0A328BPU5_9CAUL|nr:hypothetical protein [Phenylobacterium kunshanense]RAK69143.1 hypothetical protein DJ019_03825 [Phenylobacterium kunshanense]
MPSRRRDAFRVRHPLERIPRAAWPFLIAGLLVASGWYLSRNYMALRDARVRDYEAWQIEGSACPVIGEAEFLRGRGRGPRHFAYGGVDFFRRHGHVSCAPIYYDQGRSSRFYPVCQFTSPGDLLVRVDGRDWYFRPGPGQPATVSVAHGQARCVMASNFTIESEMAR